MYPGSPGDQTKWLGFLDDPRVARIPDPTNGQSLVGLDFLGIYIYTSWKSKDNLLNGEFRKD